MALVFPDVYEIGMSHVGMRILYHLVNETPGLHCERVFHPWDDCTRRIKDLSAPLTTLETNTPVRNIPLIGFSLPYEILYANVLSILSLSHIPLETKERVEQDPIVIAGGPACYNPEPMASFLDLVVIGEAEETLPELCRIASSPNTTREQRLRTMASLPGCLRPSDVITDHDENGKLQYKGIRHRPPGFRIVKSWPRSLDDTFFPCAPLVPSTEIIHDRANIEIHRGCVHGCRFCQAGYVYRPLRKRSGQTIVDMAHAIIEATGYEELGLVSLNSTDHPQIGEIVTSLLDSKTHPRVTIGLPSLRMDQTNIALARHLGQGKKTHITLAPEAGSPRLRSVINKGLTKEGILQSVEAFAAAGWRSLKLYFMVGLPTETDEDVRAIVSLVDAILTQGSTATGTKTGRPFSVTVHVSSFVAKAHTPFQWESQTRPEVIKKRISILVEGFRRNRRVTLKWRDPELGVIEGLLSRGDRRLNSVIRRVFEDGGTFESWSDKFELMRWLRALEAENLSLDEFVYRHRPLDERLPWDHISCGVSRDFLAREWKQAHEELTTPPCSEKGCVCCGFEASCPLKERTST